MKFFVLDYIVGSPYEMRARAMEPQNIGDCEYCPDCKSPATSLIWLPPYHAELLAFGQSLGDLAVGTGDSLLVSERFRKAWEESNMRGINEFSTLERVRIRPARLSKKPSTYFHIRVRLWETRIDVNKSQVKYDRPESCEKCKGSSVDAIHGFSIDESSWTGEDIFFAWGMPGTIIVTDRVRQLRDDYGLTNVNLIPTEQYIWDPLHR